jgi:energy-coupling factor transport system permease protein
MKLYAYRFQDTPVHRLHPSAITTWALSSMLLVLIVNEPIMLVTMFLATIPYIFVSRIYTNWITFMKVGVIMGVVIILFSTIFVRTGATVIFSLPLSIPTLGRVYFTLEAIYYGLAMLVRILAILTIFSVLTYAVCPDDLLDLIMKAKLPSRTAFSTSLATTYVPTLMKDMDDIQVSLTSRGYSFGTSKGLGYLKKKATIVMPLLANSLERAIQKAEAMESRAFGSMKGRTQYFDVPLTRFDLSVVVCSLLPVAMAAYLYLGGQASFIYYPRLEPIKIDFTYIMTLGAIALSVLAVLILSPLKRRFDI